MITRIILPLVLSVLLGSSLASFLDSRDEALDAATLSAAEANIKSAMLASIRTRYDRQYILSTFLTRPFIP